MAALRTASLSRAASQQRLSPPTLTRTVASTASATASSTHLPSAPPLPVRPPTSPNRTSQKASDLGTQQPRRLGAAALLSRGPLLLPPLSEFEASYYRYQRQLSQALAKPIRPAFFFRPGSHAARAFELARSADALSSLPPQDAQPSTPHARPEDSLADLQSLERAPDRSLYLLIKQTSSNDRWHLPSCAIEGSESLKRSALRAVHDRLGPDMDIWSIGRVPAAVYSPPAEGSDLDSVWIMPQRILRGKPALVGRSSKAEDQLGGVVEGFAWLTTEEIQERVDKQLWMALEPVLRR